MKILLFGANGQVGRELRRALASLGELVALGREGAPPLAADFARPETLAATVRVVAPDVIVNAAAHTAVDRCETEPDLARMLNATAVGALAHAARESRAWLVHYSTDYVFDGSGNAPWREDSPTDPPNVYGQTKLEGEQAIRASGCAHLIVRTGWIHSPRGQNFATTMLRLAAERDSIDIVADQFGAPTGAEAVADTTALMLRAVLRTPQLGGTYHLAASGETSWHGYAQYLVALARSRGAKLRAMPETIRAVTSAEFASAARRPANSRLDTTKIRAAFDVMLPPWQAGVERMLGAWLDRETR